MPPRSGATAGSAALRSGEVVPGHGLCQSASLEKLLDTGDAALFRPELWPRIGFQESAYRTPEGTHRDALFLRDLRAPEPGLLRRSLDPGANLAHGPIDFEEESLHHLAVALGTPSRFRAHVFISKMGMGVTCLPPPNDPAQQPRPPEGAAKS